MVINVIIVLHITSLVTMIVSIIDITQFVGKALDLSWHVQQKKNFLTLQETVGAHSAIYTPGVVSLSDSL